MLKTFKAEERTIRYLFSNSRKYMIPRNQREYVWGEDNLEDLWDDIYNTLTITDGEIVDMKEHFLGSCVIRENKKDDQSFIIDGQQRITTLLILLSAICQSYKKLSDEKLFTSTYRYIQSTDDYGDPYFLLKNDYLSPYFEEAILFKEKQVDSKPQNKQQKNVAFAYGFFESKIEGLNSNTVDFIQIITAIRDQVLKLKIVEIIVESEVDGYTIFEILNARGKELELHDLIKNWCMKKSPDTFPTDKIKKHWDNIHENIKNTSSSRNNMKIFLNHYYISRYGKFSDDRDMYRHTRKAIKSHNVKSFMLEIDKASEMYSFIANPTEELCESKQEYMLLKFFKTNRITQVRPILMSIYDNYINDKIEYKQMISLIQKLYNFHSLYSMVCKRPGNVIEKIYHEYASIIYKNCNKTIIEDFINKLDDVAPTYEEFESSFFEKKYTTKHDEFSSHRKAIKHIINSLEQHLLSDELLPV